MLRYDDYLHCVGLDKPTAFDVRYIEAVDGVRLLLRYNNVSLRPRILFLPLEARYLGNRIPCQEQTE